ncbi:bacterial transcriptional activator domain-containing protein [Parafrankia sp. EAN1pec]|uniref:bacterial transcriptional activator domain-containing protein n=1 Tax=Parafrankia sp. (strain EAN1pec) TaxID=298653 RepID=UPI00321AD6B5
MAVRVVGRAVLALAALTAFSMIPLVLWMWRDVPLPSTWEPARWLTLARRGYLHPDIVPNTVAVLIWIAWGQVALALLREIAAQFQRGASATRTVLLPGVVQHLAGSWIASLSILFSLLAGRSAMVAVSLDLPASHPAAGSVQTIAANAAEPMGGPAPSTSAGNALPANGMPTEGTDPGGTTWRRHVVAPGETLWGIVGGEYDDLEPDAFPPAVAEVFETNRGTTDSLGRALDRPDLINPGMELRLPQLSTGQLPGGTYTAPQPISPPAPAPAPAPPAPTPAPASPASPASPRASASPPVTVPHDVPAVPPGDEPEVPLSTWIGGAGLLATTLVGLWAARRRRRDSTVTPAQEIPDPDPATAALHAALLDADDPDLLDRLDAALRSIGAAHRDQPDGPSPQILLVQPDQSIEVLLHPDGAQTLPPPWDAGPDPRIWTLPATAALTAAADIPPPCPALVQLGTTAAGAALYADLEALGTLGIATSPTDPNRLADFCRAILAAIVASPWADLTTVRTVGLDPHAFAAEERVQAAKDVTELTDDARAEAAAIDTVLRERGYPSTLNARIAEPGEEFDPTIALLATHLDTDAGRTEAADLAAAAGHGRRGLAVVLPAQPDILTAWMLRPDPAGRGSRLDPLGVLLTPVGLTDTDEAAVAAFIADAEAPPIDLPPPDPPAETPAVFVSPPWEVMVRLLGPIDITTRDGRTPPRAETRERTNEVLAWLVTHRHGTRTDLESALWPRGAKSKTLANVLARARRLLINLVGEDAKNWVPRYDRGPLTLDPRVVSDLDILQALLRHAIDQRDHHETAIATLQEALKLVRGVPVGYPWLDAQMGSILTTAPVNAAILLAEHQLAAGDTAGVLATTARGMEILPAHTTLFALRMRAHAAAGDPDAVKAEYRSYLRAEKAEPLWDGETDRDLEALHYKLTRRRTAGSG